MPFGSVEPLNNCWVCGAADAGSADDAQSKLQKANAVVSAFTKTPGAKQS